MMEVVLVYCFLVFLNMSMASLDCSVVNKSVNCSCENGYRSHEIFKISDLENITKFLDSQIENISFSKCSKLRVELFPPYSPLIKTCPTSTSTSTICYTSSTCPWKKK